MNARERYIESLKTVSINELMDELQHSAKKLGGRPYADVAAVAHEEIEIIRAEITRRFANDN